MSAETHVTFTKINLLDPTWREQFYDMLNSQFQKCLVLPITGREGKLRVRIKVSTRGDSEWAGLEITLPPNEYVKQANHSRRIFEIVQGWFKKRDPGLFECEATFTIEETE